MSPRCRLPRRSSAEGSRMPVPSSRPGASWRRFVSASLGLALTLIAACHRTDEASATLARTHAKELAEVALHDAGELRKGLPLGAQQLAQRWASSGVDLLVDA